MNRSFRTDDNSSNSFIPSYSGTNGAVATHSNLSSMTAYSILNDDKGNAFDAAAGAMLVEGLVNPQMFGMGGEGVMILKPKDQNPLVLNGNTISPRKFDFLNLVTRGYTEVPDQGILSAGVPAAFSSIFRMLQRYGSLDFKTISQYAKVYAKEGFPIHTGIINQNKFGLNSLKDKFRKEWKNSAKLYLKNNKDIPKVGSLFKNLAYSNLLDYLGNYEKKITGMRNNKFNKLHDAFYKGDVANSILKFSKKNDGLLSKDDFENFNVKFEKTIFEKYGDFQVHKTNFWGQGLTSLMILKMANKQKIKTLNYDIRLEPLGYDRFWNKFLMINDIDGEPLDADDWVAAFNGDICVGSRQWDTSLCNNGICDVPVMGYDGFFNTNGYINQGDLPTFNIYDYSKMQYFDMHSYTTPYPLNLGE